MQSDSNEKHELLQVAMDTIEQEVLSSRALNKTKFNEAAKTRGEVSAAVGLLDSPRDFVHAYGSTL
jgi:hypothetical protein